MSPSNYPFPVSELLCYGDCRNDKEWSDYLQDLELEDQHIPELIRMATDDVLYHARSDSQEVWGPIHAWRALGRLQAISAIKPLLGLLNGQDDDWISSDFPTLCCLIGTQSIPFLEEFLADSSNDFYARSRIAETLVVLSRKYPETRDSNVAAIAGELKNFNENDSTFNALLICTLLDLQAIEVVDVIEQAFQANRVDTFVTGDWDYVQVELDLKSPFEVLARKSPELDLLNVLFPSPQKTKPPKGFGSTPSKPKKKKSHRSIGKRKKR